MTDYNTCQFTGKEWSIIILQLILWLGFHAYIFFNSLAGIILLLPLLIPKIRERKAEKISSRKQQLQREWKEVLGSVLVSLEAGYSLENSFLGAKSELEQLMGDRNSYMLEELILLERRLSMSMSIEDILNDFARRSGIEEVEDLAQIISLGKRSGGNLIHIIRKMHVSLTNKWEVEEEIATMVSGKRMEQKIMSCMPAGILLYMRITNHAYVQALYNNGLGILTGILSVAAMQWANWYAARVIKIEV